MGIFSLGSNILLSNFIRLPLPYKLTFAITYRCNSRCKTCNIWKKEPKEELRLDDIRRIFSGNSFPWINLTGGEPFLRKDIYEITKVFRNSFLLSFITNGTIPGSVKAAGKIARLGFPKFVLGVSIDGPEQLHDQIRGVSGTWKKAIATYKGFRKLRGVEAYIGFTISHLNYTKIPSTLAELKRVVPALKIEDVHFNIVQESEHYLSNKGTLKKAPIEGAIDYVLAHKHKSGIIGMMENVYLKKAKEYLKTGKTPLPCKALTSSCFIDPDGEVYPCSAWSRPLGNLREQSIKQIWDNASSVWNKVRKNQCPQCWTPCEAYQTMYGNLPKIFKPF